MASRSWTDPRFCSPSSQRMSRATTSCPKAIVRSPAFVKSDSHSNPGDPPHQTPVSNHSISLFFLLCPFVLSYKPVKFHPDLPNVRKDETAMGERCGGEKKQKERGCHHADHQLTTGVLSKMLLNLYGVCLDARRLNFLPDLSYWVNRCSLSNGLDGADG